MLDRASSRNGKHDPASAKEPCERNLHRSCSVSFLNLGEGVAYNFSCAQRKPRNECDAVALAVVHYVIPFAIGETIAVLNRHDGHNLACALDVLSRDVR